MKTVNENFINVEDFISSLTSEVAKLLENVATVERTMVTKVNEVKEGLTIRFNNEQIAPTVYFDDLLRDYSEGDSPNDVAKELVNRLDSMREKAPQMSDLDLSPEGAKRNLYASVINAEANKDLLKDTPHIIKDDLAVIARYKVADEASFIVHNNHSDAFKMTSDEILETAMKNTEAQSFKVQGIEEVLRELMGAPSSDFEDDLLNEVNKSPFYVVTNEMKVDGAIAIMSKTAMQQVYEVVGEDFYILPSSRHEILAVPESLVENPEDLKHMVEDVNSTEVSVSDKLSDNIYHYDSQIKKVSMVNVDKLDKVDELAEVLTKVHSRAI